MAERKQNAPASAKAAAPPVAGTPPSQSAKEGRKPWVKKTPVEVVLEQITRQENKVNDLREDLKKEERELQKLQQAKRVLEAT